MDWQGLLKWSIAQSDGTAQKDIKPMDEETRKWLTEAFEHYSFDEVKRMGEIVTEIMKPETNSQSDQEQRLTYLDELEEITSGLDRGKDFCKIGGMSALMKYMNDTQYPEAKLLALRIFTAANQNNASVQDYSQQNGAFDLLNYLKAQNVDIKILEQVVSAISSLVRGENLNNKRIFIDKNGFQIVLDTMCQNKNSIRIREKVLNIFKDFLCYDNVLHQTYNDIGKQSNTNAASQKNQMNLKLKEDINDQLKNINELPENAKYKNISKQILNSLGVFKMEFASLILESLENRLIDSRISFLEILSALIETNKSILTPDLREYLAKHQQKVKELNQTNDDFNQLELDYLEKIFT